MIRAVRLDQLPEDVTFPPELSTKISYDSKQRQLQFEGFMSKTDFDKLLRLHNDLSYQRSLEQLFQKCTFTSQSVAAPTGRSKLPALSLAAAAVVLVIAVGSAYWFGFRNRGVTDQTSTVPLVQTVRQAIPSSSESVDPTDNSTYAVAIEASAEQLESKSSSAPAGH